MIGSHKEKILIILALMLLPVMLCAGGQKEDSLVTARTLMEEKKWDEAILVLKSMMLNHPSRFDDGQLLVQEIMFNKRIYNDYFQRLVDAYLEGDLDLAYSIIREMEMQDPNPNPRTRALIVEARATAGVIATRNRYERIMAEAKTAIDEERLYDAIGIYLSGSDIARDLFGDLSLGNVVENQIDAQNQQIQELARELAAMKNEFTRQINAANALRKPVPGNSRSFSDFSAAITAANASMDPVLEKYRQIVTQSVDFLLRHDFLVEANNLEKDIFHLKYLAYMYSGRPSSDYFEGITGVIDILTGRIIDPMESMAFGTVKEMFDKAVLLHRSDAFTDSVQSLSELTAISDIYFTSVEGWSKRTLVHEQSGDLWRNNIRDYEELTKHLAYVQTVRSLQFLYTSASTIAGDFVSLMSRQESVLENAELLAARMRITSMINLLSALDPDGALSEVTGSIDGSDAVSAVEGFRDDKENLMSRITALDTDIEVKRIRLAVEEYERRLSGIREEANRGISLLDGIPSEEQDIPVRDPAAARVLFLQKIDDGSVLEDDVNLALSGIEGDKDYIRESEELAVLIERMDSVKTTINSYSGEMSQEIVRADEMIFQAQRYRQEAADYFQEARSLLSRNEFDRAKQRVENAASMYDQALALQRDEAIQRQRDVDIPAFYDEIVSKQRGFIFEEVRSLITQGRSQYAQNSFLEAESTLLRAQARYSEVSIDPEPEVEYWLSLAQTALSVNSGREILPVDPLYPEMTQLLNLAREDFQQAQDSLNTGKRTLGLSLLDQAESKILMIQQPFPLNLEASILALKILQLRNPAEFDTIFTERFTSARTMIRTNPQDAYIELKNLQALRPNHRGMDTAIYEAEVATGIRVPPPDTTNIRRARELYDQAYRIVIGNVTSQFPVALTAVNEAIRLNPDYIEAIRLKDRIQASGIGSTGVTAILSARDQLLYEEAVNDYQNGLYREAQLKVERLLQNRDNQRNTKVLDLKERIASRL